MGYACPVCSDPQSDAGHLANHLAFTAILGEESHEAWLEENAPGWGEMDEAELAGVVAEDAEETEFPQLFEDSTANNSDPTDPVEERSGALFDDGHEHAHGHGDRHSYEIADLDASADERTADVLEEAREMTRKMLEESDEDASQ